MPEIYQKFSERISELEKQTNKCRNLQTAQHDNIVKLQALKQKVCSDQSERKAWLELKEKCVLRVS